MPRKLVTVLLAALIACTAFPYTSFAAKATGDSVPTVAVADPLSDATVNLYCRLKAGNKIYSISGSGAFISPRGVILTNAHVAQYFLLAREKGRVTGTCTVRTGSPAKDTYTASILYLPPNWLTDNVQKVSEKAPRGSGIDDFALLYVTGATKKQVLPTTFPFVPAESLLPVSEGEAIRIGGYPSENKSFKDVQRKLAQVTATSTITSIRSFDSLRNTDILVIGPSSAGAHGTSGGPVINAAGHVIGIATSKGSDVKDTSLRAVSLLYVDRTLRSTLGSQLSTLLTGDFATRAALTTSTISPDLVETFANELRKKK